MSKKFVKKVLRTPYNAWRRKLEDIILSSNQQLYERLDKHHEERMADLFNYINEKTERLSEQINLQNEIAATNTAAFEEYKNKYSGQEIVVLGAGPSLNYYKPIANAIHIGVNKLCQYNNIELDYYFTQDFVNPSPFINDISKLKCKVFLGIIASLPPLDINASESLSARLNATRYYFDRSPSEYICTDIRFHPLMDFYTVIFPVIHFALYTNPKSIYLVGCDTSYSGYFTNERILAPKSKMRYIFFQRFLGYKKLKEFAQHYYPDTNMYSINPVNLRGLFEDMYTDDYIVNNKKNIDQSPLYGDWEITNEMISQFITDHLAEISE